MDILRSTWLHSLIVNKVLLLNDPNPDHALVLNITQQFNTDRGKCTKTAMEWDTEVCYLLKRLLGLVYAEGRLKRKLQFRHSVIKLESDSVGYNIKVVNCAKSMLSQENYNKIEKTQIYIPVSDYTTLQSLYVMMDYYNIKVVKY